ncbi:MAG: hypothetical protein J6R86_04175 [Lentisphaeria bacterium]|nr:hypothetical protein [Lentisphaeria bacterium]
MKKFIVMLSAVFAVLLFGADTVVNGDFPEPRKPGLPPAGWNLMSGSKGSLEIIRTGSGNAVLMTSEAGKNVRYGIYSPAIAAVAGDTVEITANIRGNKDATVGIFQYSEPRGTSSQNKLVKLTAAGAEVKVKFTVKDTPKGKTAKIRAVFFVANGSGASVAKPKVTVTKAAEAAK